MDPDHEHQEFHPELLSRRGELTAWVLAVAALTAWLLVLVMDAYIFIALPILAVLLLLAALSISLGNWMDRQSVIKIEDDGILFSNGIRHTNLKWKEIKKVEVNIHKWGNKVHVIGEHAHFSFRTLGEVSVGGEVKGRMGFVDGDKILQLILERSSMREIGHEEDYYYYARE